MSKRLINGPVVLVVLDGWGLREDQVHNGVALAKTPYFDHLVKTYPFTQLLAAGEAVGLPEGQMGNSEIGHTTIGAGCVLYQDLVRITKDVEAGAFAQNAAFQQAFEHVKTNDSHLHVLGILSQGGVHGHETHLQATVRAAREAGIEKIVIHAFLDGRDSSKTSGVESMKRLEAFVKEIGGCHISTLMGRYYSMDRDTNWDRTDLAFRAIFTGEGEDIREAKDQPSAVIKEKYTEEEFDEHIQPVIFKTESGAILEVQTNDALIFTNFRKDRTRQLSGKICEQREDKNLCFVTMTEYDKNFEAIVAYKPESISTTLGEVISNAGLTQVHIAETEKFPHVTFYVNGGHEEAYPGEEDVQIPSRKDVKTHDQAPEMRAKEICDAALERLSKTDFMFINFANPDMVGHTANQPAIMVAIETVDRELKKLSEAVLAANGALVVIADHGNAEVMVDPVTGEPHTAHTTNPVPFILVSNSYQPELRHDEPGLKDVAPTVLQLLGLEKPSSMTGSSVIE